MFFPSQVNCGICQSSIEGFKSRKHILYYSAEGFVVISLLLLTLVYFGSNTFLRDCHHILPPSHCSSLLVSIAILLHVSSPILLFAIFWCSTFFVTFKVMVTVYDTNGGGSSNGKMTHSRLSGGMG